MMSSTTTAKIHIRLWFMKLLVALVVLGLINFVPYDSGQINTADSLRIPLRGANGISVGPDGDIFIIERTVNRIIRCSRVDGAYKIFADYSWKDAADNYPRDIITVNGLDIYVADYNNHRILRFDRNLNLVSRFPSDEQDWAAGRVFGYPRSISVDRFGSLYILDGENNRIVKIGKSSLVERSFGGYDAGKGRLKSPKKVRVSNHDRVYVQDQGNIVVFDIYGNYIRTIGQPIFQALTTFAVDRDTIYALDDCKVFVLSQDGVSIDTILVRQSIPDYECNGVVDMDAKQGELYFLDEHSLIISRIGNNPVREIN